MSGQSPRTRGFVHRLLFGLDREEAGYPPHPDNNIAVGGNHPEIHTGAHADRGAKRLTIATTNADSLIPPNDKLLVFRALTGIDSVPALTTPGHSHRTAPNVGIYTRVVQAENAAASGYRFYSILINTCLAIQIVVAAALTAIGAASGPHSAVTAFGAINTIMAGILTYLKGSGLPDKLKHFQTEWRNVREYVEQREREFCLVGCELDVQEEVIIVERMYEGVKSEIEASKSTESRLYEHGGRQRRSFLPSSTTQDVSTERERRLEHTSPIAVPEGSHEKH